METTSLNSDFAARFAAAPLPSLVESFNHQIGNRGWTSARSVYDKALMDEFIRRGIDVSAACDGTRTSFAHHVRLDNKGTSLVAVD